ncbi:MAG: hypothetical protein V4650_06240 [Pseudomonadota bacterium]
MSSTRISLIGAVALLLLGACASPGPGRSPVVDDGVPEYGGGIQTRSMGAAPASREAVNESKPLSELNTPEAVAAREQSARSAPRSTAPAAPRPPVTPENSETAAAEALLASADPHKQNAALQKGAKVRARSGASLRSRPSDTSEIIAIPSNIEIELGPQVYNAAGYWWYATAGKETGWLLQADIAR